MTKRSSCLKTLSACVYNSLNTFAPHGCASRRMKELRVRRYKCTVKAGHALQKIVQMTTEARNTSNVPAWVVSDTIIANCFELDSNWN